MTLGEKIFKLRTERGLSQETFGDKLGVSRQSVSKWETDQSLPELEKIIALSEFFGVSTDYLLKDTLEEDERMHSDNSFRASRLHFEYKSKKIVKGLPLVHVNFGLGLYRAKGIFAFGNIAQGVLAIGFISAGVVSMGLLTAGIVLSLGTIAVALLVAMGNIAIGSIALGAITVGIFCLGALNIGEFSIGALSYGRQVAIGDEAHGRIALGFSRAYGEIYEEVSKSYKFDYPAIERIINENVSSYWFPFKSWIKGILRMM
ncbi:MAG: helix-turn-helix domain-containing protein [Lachnospiraceae bacterium]|nr:helix-turn-helix domain-containing protein [Lachnospiraceae bacterium]